MHRANYDFLLGSSVLLIGSGLAPVWLVNMHDLRHEEGKRHAASQLGPKVKTERRQLEMQEEESELDVCVFVC